MSTHHGPWDGQTPADQSIGPASDPAGVTAEGDAPDHEVIRITAPGDAVALVHHTLGFLPEESLVVVGLHGDRTGAQLRIDLRAGVDHPDGLAEWVGRHLAGPEVRPTPDGVVVLLFTDEEPTPPSWGDPALRSWAALHASLCESLQLVHGVEVVQTWWIGGRHIRDYDCLAPDCCPYPGLGIEAAASSAVGVRMAQAGRVLRTPPEFVESFLRPDPRPAGELVGEVVSEAQDMDLRISEVHAAAEALRIWDDVLAEESVGTALADLEGLTAGPEDVRSCPMPMGCAPDEAGRLASLTATLESSDLAEAVLALAADGPEAVTVSVHLMGLGEREDLWAGCSAGDLDALWPALARAWRRHLFDLPGPLEAFGAPREQDVPPQDVAEIEAMLRSHLQHYHRVLSGATGRRPRWDRIDALESVLHRLQPFLGEGARSTSLAMMAWIEWARGRGTISGAFVDRSVELAPLQILVRLVSGDRGRPIICPWAMVRDHSWAVSRRR